MVANPFAKANNPKVEGYDPKKPSSYIQLVDCNNQYGWAIGQFLPTHGFEWLPLDTESLEQVVTVCTFHSEIITRQCVVAPCS